jgi:hypothetical protein
MRRWITRKTLGGIAVERPRRCYDAASIIAIPGMRTIDECVHLMLREDEVIVDSLDQLTIHIKRAGAVVGYFEITRIISEPSSSETSVSGCLS